MNINFLYNRMYGNKVLNFTDVFKYMQVFEKCVCRCIEFGIKRQRAL